MKHPLDIINKKLRHLFKMLWCCHDYVPEKTIYEDNTISDDGFWQIMSYQYTIYKCTKCGKTKKKLTKVFPKYG